MREVRTHDAAAQKSQLTIDTCERYPERGLSWILPTT
jgi:hypothetical protein